MRILIQVPEGLKTRALRIAEEFERKGATVFISCEPCYGACDLRLRERDELGAEKLVHFGHEGPEIPGVEYVPLIEKIDIRDILARNLEKLHGYRTIRICASLQFCEAVFQAAEVLSTNGFEPVISTPPGLRPGQILGCDTRAAEGPCDAVLFIGSGRFHARGIGKKPVFVLDIEKGTVFEIGINERKYTVALELAKHSSVFGILVSTKPGQKKVETALEVKKVLEENGKKAFILVFDEIKKEKLMGIDVDCYVNTACPRIVEDDLGKPVVNAGDILKIFKRSNENKCDGR
ncbi:MAG: diphthamide biosynthesis enzyme Dph2 [Candidatus Micrarchaeota archaeon]|nr:diphthamide biosynthesis enzyme Dph2 [Candidatus Micrarchaeota archaeon]